MRQENSGTKPVFLLKVYLSLGMRIIGGALLVTKVHVGHVANCIMILVNNMVAKKRIAGLIVVIMMKIRK